MKMESQRGRDEEGERQVAQPSTSSGLRGDALPRPDRPLFYTRLPSTSFLPSADLRTKRGGGAVGTILRAWPGLGRSVLLCWFPAALGCDAQHSEANQGHEEDVTPVPPFWGEARS